MKIFITSIESIIPIIAIIVLGYILQNRGWFGENFGANLSRLIMNIALPASIFVSVMMGIIVFASYTLMYKNIIKSNLITLMISILIGMVSYLLMVIKFEVISREELQTIPLGNKIVAILDRQDEIKEGRKRVKNRRERNRKI